MLAEGNERGQIGADRRAGGRTVAAEPARRQEKCPPAVGAASRLRSYREGWLLRLAAELGEKLLVLHAAGGAPHNAVPTAVVRLFVDDDQIAIVDC